MADSGIGGILNKQTAGLPNWAWVAIVGAGLAAAYLVPKFMHPASTSDTSSGTPGTPGTASPPVDSSQSFPSSMGMSGIDPTTGLPYSLYGNGYTGGMGGYQTPTTSGAFPTTTVGGNTVPVVPGGFQPIYDNNGNLVGFQQSTPAQVMTPPSQAPTTSGTGTGTVTPTVPPVQNPPPAQAPPPTVTPVQTPPPPASGGTTGTMGTPGSTGTTPTAPASPVGMTVPQGSFVYFGSGGRVWYQPPGGTQTILTGPGGGYLPDQTFITYGPNGTIYATFQGQQWTLCSSCVQHAPGQTPTQSPPPPSTTPTSTARYVTVAAWPAPLSTLSGIASANGVTVQRLEQLNPQITNPLTIQPGQKVRVA